jgi:hypothetical protein
VKGNDKDRIFGVLYSPEKEVKAGSFPVYPINYHLGTLLGIY